MPRRWCRRSRRCSARRGRNCMLVDIGPGSFTGIRIGIAAARALGVAWGVPVLGFSGTGLVAAAAFAADPALAQVAAVIDAGRGQRFVETIGRDFSGGTIATIATRRAGAGRRWRWQGTCRTTLPPCGAASPIAAMPRSCRPPRAACRRRPDMCVHPMRYCRCRCARIWGRRCSRSAPAFPHEHRCRPRDCRCRRAAS